MASLRTVCALALLAACGPNVSTDYDTFPEPVTVAGPPGGEIDPGWGVAPASADPGAYPDGYADSSYDQAIEPSSDPNDAGYVMGAVTDEEINATLAGKGEWVWSDEYGWIWRPYATEVGVDFTPYETAGSWVWTDWGWTYASDWDWGWLAFHYGRWGWYDDYWAWQPDYEWSPAWCEWRSGGGYVGWRPLGPTIRDHRGEHVGPTFRDHRKGQGPQIRDHRTHHAMDSHWRFTKSNDFGKRIRPNLARTPAEGLRVTSTVTRPPVRPNYQPVHVASLMRGRLALRESMSAAGGIRAPSASTPPSPGIRTPSTSSAGASPGHREFGGPRGVAGSDPAVWAPGRQQYPTYRPPRPRRPSTTITQPGYGTPDRTPAPAQPSHPRPSFDDHPSRPDFDRAPSQPTWTPPSHPRPSFGDRPSRPDRAPPQPTWTPPSRPRPSFNDHPRPTWTPPARDSRPSGNWSPPSRPSSPPPSSRPSRGSWNAPSRPSRSSSSGGSWSPPSRPSSGSSSGSWGSRGSSSSSSSSSRGSSHSSGGSWGSRGSSSSSSSSSRGSSRSSGGSWGGSRGSSGGGGGARGHRR